MVQINYIALLVVTVEPPPRKENFRIVYAERPDINFLLSCVTRSSIVAITCKMRVASKARNSVQFHLLYVTKH